jgi:hypothetical protein
MAVAFLSLFFAAHDAQTDGARNWAASCAAPTPWTGQ